MQSEMKEAVNQIDDSCSLARPGEVFTSLTDTNAERRMWAFFSHFNTKCSNTTGGVMCWAQSNQGLLTHFVLSAGDICLPVSITGTNKLLPASNNNL